jgi:hypothetical protein
MKNDNLVEEIELDGFTGKIYYDSDPSNPREEWDNLCTMVCFHKRYNLGDKKHGYSSSDYGSWEELYNHIMEEYGNKVVIKSIFMYEHGGITISTGPFSCGWDSGQIGFIFISHDKMNKEWASKPFESEEALIKQANDCIDAEIETYDQYLRGDVYGFEIEDPDGECVDSCWGFHGIEYMKQEVNDILKFYVNKYIENEKECDAAMHL